MACVTVENEENVIIWNNPEQKKKMQAVGYPKPLTLDEMSRK